MNRRRFLTLLGTSAGAVMLPLPVLATTAQKDKLYYWRGILLGTEVSFQLYHDEAGTAKNITQKAVKEIKRLEAIFSLYQADSAISKLNKYGKLTNAPSELAQLLKQSNHYSELTNGAFDITVQPLWNIYSQTPSPTPHQLQTALAKVGYKNIEVTGNNIKLHNAAEITLNGIAQGFITDSITKLLKSEGMVNTLVELGETRALGKHVDNRQWQIGLRNANGQINDIIPLNNRALATSGAYGTKLGNGNHLLNPQTGQSTKHHSSVSIIAPSATTADALSTGLSILPYSQAQKILDKLPNIEARFS